MMTKQPRDEYDHENDDQLSSINSEDLGTDDLWSDMDTIVEEHPLLNGENGEEQKEESSKKKKRKLSKRLEEVSSDLDLGEANENNDHANFKKPK